MEWKRNAFFGPEPPFAGHIWKLAGLTCTQMCEHALASYWWTGRTKNQRRKLRRKRAKTKR